MARRDLTLPPLPALAEAQGELDRLGALVAERHAASEAAAAAAVQAQAADAAERVAAIREQREPAQATEPAAVEAAQVAEREAADASAALTATLEDVRAQVVAGAPEMRAALEADEGKARRKLGQKVAAARQAADELGDLIAAVNWLSGVEAGRLRPFTPGRSMASPLAQANSSGYLTAQALLDGLDAIASGERPGPRPLYLAEEAQAS